ncbi:MAG: hypothetical protein ACJ798_17360 [Phenylobacterium sp.]
MRAPAFVVAGLLLCLAGAAQAEPLFPLFRTFCLETHASRSEALSAAEKANWTPVPKGMLSAFKLSGIDLTDAEGRMTSTADGLQALVVAHANHMGPVNAHPAEICAVAVSPTDPAAVKAEAAEFASVDPIVNNSDSTLYAWRDAGGRHAAVTTEQLTATSLDPTISILVAGGGSPPFVALIVPSK